MSTNARDLLMRGIAAAKAKDVEEARFYLDWVLRTDGAQEQRQEALYWLTEIGGDPAEQRRHLTTILAENPGHARARRKLALLDGRLRAADLVDPDRVAATAEDNAPQPAGADRFACPRCGARMVYTPDGSALHCEYCALRQGMTAAGPDASVQEQDFIAALATAQGHRRPVTMRTFRCQGCDVVFSLAPETLSFNCPYCDAVYVLKTAESRTLVPPHGLIPFALSAGQAQRALRAWLKAGRLGEARITEPHGFYLPVWLFTVGGAVEWRYVRQDSEGRTSVQTGTKPALYDDVRVAAGGRLPPGLADEVNQFNLQQLVAYDPRYLADWPAEQYALSLANASLLARRQTLAKLRKQISYAILESYRDLTVNPANLYVESFRLVLLPLWLAHYSVAGKRYHAAVNGQTGAVRGEKPRRGLVGWLGRLFGGD